MQQIVWLSNSIPAHLEARELSGTYTASFGGTDCVVELWLSGEGFVSGSLSIEGERLEVRGGFSVRTGALQGFLLEPFGAVPVALFRGRLSGDGLTLEVDVPDFDELIELCNPERIVFSRVSGQAEEGL